VCFKTLFGRAYSILLRTSKQQDEQRQREEEDVTGWVIIINPNAGGGAPAAQNLRTLQDTFRSMLGRGVKFTVAWQERNARAAVRAAIKGHAGTIVALGGDGTVNMVVNAFLQEYRNEVDDLAHSRPKPAIAFVPMGTRNVLAKSLGLPADLPSAIDCMKSSQARPLDVILVTATTTTKKKIDLATDEDGSSTITRFCLNAAEVGVGASIGGVSKRFRKVLNVRPVATAASVIRTVPIYRSNKCAVSIDDGKDRELLSITMCVVANCRNIGGGIEAAPRADPADGLLDLMILMNAGSLKFLYEILKIKISVKAIDEKGVFYSQAKKVRLSALDPKKEIPVTVDGEPIGFLPATFEVLPHAILFRP
jgi:diacylglycerol kinase (ATP)